MVYILCTVSPVHIISFIHWKVKWTWLTLYVVSVFLMYWGHSWGVPLHARPGDVVCYALYCLWYHTHMLNQMWIIWSLFTLVSNVIFAILTIRKGVVKVQKTHYQYIPQMTESVHQSIVPVCDFCINKELNCSKDQFIIMHKSISEWPLWANIGYLDCLVWKKMHTDRVHLIPLKHAESVLLKKSFYSKSSTRELNLET